MTPNSAEITYVVKALRAYYCLWKLKSLSNITPKLRTLSDGVISSSSNLTGKWLEILCRCCFVPIIINSVLSEFSLVYLISSITKCQ